MARAPELIKAVLETGYRGASHPSNFRSGASCERRARSRMLTVPSHSCSACPSEGVFSFEVFEQQYMSLPDPTVPERYARAGQLSKSRIFDAILQL